MPAPVLVVHEETRELAVTTLRSAFLGVVGFEDPMAALDAIETDSPRPGLGHVRRLWAWQTARRSLGSHGKN